MGDLAEANRERPDLQLVGPVVLVHVKGMLDQILATPAGDDGAERVGRAQRRVELGAGRVLRSGPPGHWHRLLARRVRQRVRERNQIEEVVGVHVADDHRSDIDVVAESPQLREDAVAAVEQQPEPVPLDQIPTAGASGVLPRWRLPQHSDTHLTPLFLARRL